MSVAVVIAFVGALVAAVGVGVLAGRLIRAPRSDLAAWAAVLLALAVALGAQTMGFALGFSDPLFRAVAVTGVLLAPLWTAWGLVELAARSLPARFAIRLLTGALTVVPGVILVLDPLNPAAVSKAWPGEARYMTLPKTALTVVHVVAVAIALVMMILAAVRTRRDPAWWHVFVPVAAAGAAVLLTVSMGLTLPSPGYPLLATAATVAVWFAASLSERVNREELRLEEAAAAGERPEPRRGRRRRGQLPPDAAERAARGRDPFDRPAGAVPTDAQATGPAGGDRFGVPPIDDRMLHARPAGEPRDGFPSRHDDASVPVSPPHGVASPGVGSRLFGLIAIYTLSEGGSEDFDRLADEIVESVRRNEPDTLLFIVHTVPKAPMQRIFYEVYRDRMAYAEHRRQPDVEDFFARHRPYVLATNVIELDLRYAKASALPSLATMFTPETNL